MITNEGKKAFKFRIYPTPKQVILINKTIGCSRFVYNFFVGKQKKKDAYWTVVNEMVQSGQLNQNNWKGIFFNKNHSIKTLPQLKKYYPFLKEVDSIALQKSVEIVNDSYVRYYKKQNGQPRFNQKRTLFSPIPPNLLMGIFKSMIDTLNCQNSDLFALRKAGKSKDG